MGVSTPTAEFLIDAARHGVDFRDTLTLGHQHLAVGPWRLGHLLEDAGLLPAGRRELYQELATRPWFADPLFRALGASNLASLDISAHEGATILWDLNEPVSTALDERFGVVFDAGSLEHVFRAATALESCMRMTRVGGHVIIVTPANNYFGHGLHQLGPEFFFASLNEGNGFVVERMLAIEHDVDAPAHLFGAEVGVERHGPTFHVADSARAGGRVALVNRRPVLLMIRAQRVAKRPLFASSPQQSDYVERWAQSGTADGDGAKRTRPGAAAWARRTLSSRAQLHLMLDVLPRLAPVLDPLRPWREGRRRSFRNPGYFRRAEDAGVTSPIGDGN